MSVRAIGLATMFAMVGTRMLACACCADHGERFEVEVARSDYSAAEFARLAAAGPAQVFLTACGMDCVRGADVSGERLEVSLDLAGWAMTLEALDQDGSLRMRFPDVIERFAVDLNPVSEGRHVALYSEFRMVGEIEASGVFAAAQGAGGMLVLAGKTNHCWAAEDLGHWVLDVQGAAAEFRLFGKLVVRE